MSPAGPLTNTSSKIYPEGIYPALYSHLTPYIFSLKYQNRDMSIPSCGKTASLHQEFIHSLNSPGHSHSLTHRTLSRRSSAAKCLCLAHTLAQIPHELWMPTLVPVPVPVPAPTPQSTLVELVDGFPPPLPALFPVRLYVFYMALI